MRKQQDIEDVRRGPWRELVEGREPERAPRGRLIYTPTTPADELLLLTSGKVGLYLTEADRRPLTLGTVVPGRLFGHVAVVGGHYDSYAEAHSAVSLIRISRDEVHRAMESESQLGLALLDELGLHRLEVSRRLDELAFKSVPARLASVLLGMAPEDAGSHPVRVPRHSHRQLAEMINAYRETVTKVLNQFRAARLLEIDQSFFTLVNRSRLEELAQGW